MRTFDRSTTGHTETDLISRLMALRGRLRRSPALASEILDAMEACIPRYPLKVQIQTTTHCNAACRMCPYPDITQADGFKHARMDEALFSRILEQLQQWPVERVSLFLMNEPLLDVRLTDWIQQTRAALPRAQLGLFTNGSALNGERAKRLAQAGLDELCISVHGFDRRIYEDVMHGLSYERLQRNLRDVFGFHRAGALGSLRLNIVTGDLPGLAKTREAADPLYADHILLKAFSNEREVLNLPGEFDSSARDDRAASTPLCQRPMVKMYILATGECVLCNVDWRRSVVLGQIGSYPGKGSLAEIWNGDVYRDARRQHLKHAFDPGLICSRCDYASVVDHE
jgi:hypothetical protein